MSASVDPRTFLKEGDEAIIRHWSTYGQKGMTPERRAMPWDWNQTPFISPRTSKWHVPVKPHQMPLLLLGFIPSNPPNNQAHLAEVFQVGETVETHGFMSGSQNPKLKASEDKWFIYAIGPTATGMVTLTMCRSWSGDTTLELKIQTERMRSGGVSKADAHITHITWDTDPNRWKDMNEETAKEVATEVCRWVLGVDFHENEVVERPAVSAGTLDAALRRLPPMGQTSIYSQR